MSARKPHPSIRLFENPYLEMLTHVHPVTPVVVWAPVIAWLYFRSVSYLGMGFAELVAMTFLGLLVWTFTEYTLHRFVFHFPAKRALGKRIIFLIHGLHHDDPVDPTRLVMPPVAAIFFATILFLFFRAFMGPYYVEPFFAAFLIGYLIYDYTHFAVHHWRLRGPIFRFLKQFHMDHHFVSQDSRWGVSSPLWDYVFGTAEGPEKKRRTA